MGGSAPRARPKGPPKACARRARRPCRHPNPREPQVGPRQAQSVHMKKLSRSHVHIQQSPHATSAAGIHVKITRKPHHRHATTTKHALRQLHVSPARVQCATGQALFGSAGCCSGGHCAVARKCREALELCSPPPPPPPLAALIRHISTAYSLQGKAATPAHVNSPPHRCTKLHFLPRPQRTQVHARTPPRLQPQPSNA